MSLFGNNPRTAISLRNCGCWYIVSNSISGNQRQYIPLVDLDAHTTILSTTSRTKLTQTYRSQSSNIDQASYTFPIHDGVSVVGFQCKIGSRIIRGIVKEKEQARTDYTEAVQRGETAGLLEQSPQASDVFITRLGNIPANQTVIVEIVYLGELAHDAEADGLRFTIPTEIAPRYGPIVNDTAGLPDNTHAAAGRKMRITVDAAIDKGSSIQKLSSTTHPLDVTFGKTSQMTEVVSGNRYASATLALDTTELEKDFVLIMKITSLGIPRALLETHPQIPNQRALMATLVPKFNIPPMRPEIVFVVDRSGSMSDKIDTVRSALRVFLKSLPVGVRFNICSFGSKFDFLWKRSKSYSQSTLDEALKHVDNIHANYGGTSMFAPVQSTVQNRFKDLQLEVMMLTDGQITDQSQLFDLIRNASKEGSIRFFSIGIGAHASTSLVDGIARAGNGFAQFVAANEALDKKVIRMLKGALTPHIKDYTLEIKYDKEDEEFEMVESVTDSLKTVVTDVDHGKSENNSIATGEAQAAPSPISLFGPSAQEEPMKAQKKVGESRYSHLPKVAPPNLLQTPCKIPALYPFNRTTVYLLMDPGSCQRKPKSVLLHGTSSQGPLELEIEVEDIGKGMTLHQLAAKKAVQELEEGGGWITAARDGKGLIKDRHASMWDELVEREAVRLGVQYQVGGKWCSFVAVEKDKTVEQAGEKNSRRWVQSEDPAVSDDDDDDMGFALFDDGAHIEPPAPPIDRAKLHELSSTSSGMPGLYQSVLTGTPGGRGPGNPKVYGRKTKGSSLFGNSTDTSGLGSAGPNTGPKTRANFASLTPDGQQSNSSPSFGLANAPPPSNLFGSHTPTIPLSQIRRQFAMSQEPSHNPPSSDQLSAWNKAWPDTLADLPPSPGKYRGMQNMVLQADRRMVGRGGRHQSPDRSTNTVQSKSLFEVQSNVDDDDADDDMGRDATASTAKFDTLEDRMYALIALQSFEGSWEWNDQLLAVLDVEGGSALAATTPNFDMGERVRATVLAIAFLEGRLPKEVEAWDLVVEKARLWLTGEVGDDAAKVEKMIETARKACFESQELISFG